jgi:hypothetical protein
MIIVGNDDYSITESMASVCSLLELIRPIFTHTLKFSGVPDMLAFPKLLDSVLLYITFVI